MKTVTACFRFLLLTILFMAVAFPGYGQYATEIKILPDDGGASDYFGRSVAIEGEYAIVGADLNDAHGSAYVFRRNAGGDWVLVKKLAASDAASGDHFGFSVAMSGNYAIVGAACDDDNGNNSGSAYIFSRNQGGSDNWGQVAKLTAGDGAEFDQFGSSVAISGDHAIVAAYSDDDNGSYSGSAYIFSRNQGGSDHWGQVTKLTAGDGSAEDWFGYSVAISGDYAIVGAQGDDDNGSNSGSAYIYSRNQGGSDLWGQLTKLTAGDGSASDEFGRSVALNGDYAIVGAQGDDDNGYDSGSAYIFSRNQGGSDNWGQLTKLSASDGAADDQFGFSVAMSDDYTIVGATGDDDNGSSSGSAYIFSRNQGGSNNWGQLTKLTASDGAAEYYFGSSVAICGDYAIVGAPFDNDNGSNSGSAYVYGPALAPEMDVQGGSPRVSIANGDDTPSLDDGTNFGGTNVGDSKAETFFIYNTGSANLNLTVWPGVQFTGPHAADFYLSTIYNTTIAPGGNTEFEIVFAPSAPGWRTATVVIPNNDPDENPYDFAIQGTGIAAGDNEPPVITTKPGTIELWPPNHKYKTITVARCVASVSDNCANLSIDDVVISQVTSDEPEDAKGGGDGNTKKDIVIASDYRSVQLRRERDGSGNGRVYTLHFAVDDGAGNIGRATYLVTVPKSQNGAPAVDDGPVYIVNSGCGILPKSVSYQDDAEEATLPDGYALEQNYPNPFNPETQIRFATPEAGAVTLQIFNSAGQLVRTLVAGEMSAGNHQVTWNATDDSGRRVASGLYIYMLRAGAFTAQHKLVLMK